MLRAALAHVLIAPHEPLPPMLEDRLLLAMRRARKLQPWFEPGECFRAAVEAVLDHDSTTAEERVYIEVSLLPHKILVAAADGVPVDLEGFDWNLERLPLSRLWAQSVRWSCR